MARSKAKTQAFIAALARKAQRGDLAARNQLMLANQGLLGAVAKKIRGGFVDLDDLVSEGQFALAKAIDTFDPDRGTYFSTYAWLLVRQQMLSLVARERKHHMHRDSPKYLLREASKDDHLADVVLRMDVEALLAQLPPEQAQMLRDRYLYGMTVRAVARMARLCTSGVHRTTNRARQQFRDKPDG